ncbi:hypothetical protein AXG89_32040 (plasmid) [Burkholderia sp. PAMC 26561]|nr:hypothetical protein AXG89_32040 [Burkholderia sp. PAMC 26561]
MTEVVLKSTKHGSVGDYSGGRPMVTSEGSIATQRTSFVKSSPRAKSHSWRRHDHCREKDGDTLGYTGHKHLKGDKVVAIFDHRCIMIASFVPAPG